jgi:uncharacterized protein YfdQ (DUF2303 family)
MESTRHPLSNSATAMPFLSESIQVAQTLAVLATAAAEANSKDNHHYVMVPPGHSAKDITELVEKAQPHPNRPRGTVKLQDIDSLLIYCADQTAASDASKYGYIYANANTRDIVAVFNDHRAGPAGWRDHRAEFKAEFTPEFDKWFNRNKQTMEQGAFAEFIEDNMADITEPAATVMLEMATTIQAKTDINFSSSKRLDNGQVQLGYTENIDARAGANGALAIPKVFNLGMRVFKNGEGYKLQARLKFRLNGGSVKFWYELDRPERVIEAAFSGYVETLREKSGYAVLLGTP